MDWLAFEEAFRQYVPDSGGVDSLRAVVGDVASGSFVDLAEQRGSDRIVMGVHAADSIATHFAPGTAAKALMEAPCPVMTPFQP